MNQTHLRDLLHDHGSRVPVGPPPHADIARRAKRRRGRAVAASAAGLTAVVLIGSAVTQQIVTDDPVSSAGAPEEQPTPVDLPTSNWNPSMGGDDALISGVLARDENDCAYLSNGADQTWALWPAGYSASVSEGTVSLFDADGQLVAVEGQRIQMGGGHADRVGVDADTSCLPRTGSVAFVQSEVTRAE